MFAERGPDDVVMYTSGKIIEHTISHGDSLTLRTNDQEDVLVRDVVVLEPGRYMGTICGFEPSRALEHGGLSMDQEIEFREPHVFGVREA